MNDLSIDLTKPKENRIRYYIKKTRNPYLVRFGDTVVEMAYSENGRSLQSLIEEIVICENP